MFSITMTTIIIIMIVNDNNNKLLYNTVIFCDGPAVAFINNNILLCTVHGCGIDLIMIIILHVHKAQRKGHKLVKVLKLNIFV